jgi:alpha-L-fucosidase
MASWMGCHADAVHATRPLEPGSAEPQDSDPWVRWTRDEQHVYAFVADAANAQFVLRTHQGLLHPGTAERLDGRPIDAAAGPDGIRVTTDGLGTPLPTVIRFAARV